MPIERCPIDLAWELKQDVKGYIQQKTDEDPYYALVTGALHARPVDYTKTQPFVEEIVRRGPEAWLSEKKNVKFLKTPIMERQYQYPKQAGKVLKEITRCYLGNLEHMSRREAALACSDPNIYQAEEYDIKGPKTWKRKSHRTGMIVGISRKGANLMREYLGDDEAVAVDRHVLRYVCDTHGYCPMRGGTEYTLREKKDEGTVEIPVDIQKQVEWQIKQIAHECDRPPAEVQAAAWLKGACDSRVIRRAREPKQEKKLAKELGLKGPIVWLGDDKVIDCGDPKRPPPFIKGQSKLF